MTRFWFLVRIQLGRPMEVYDAEGRRIVERHTHYRQYFGITAESSELAFESVKRFLASKGDLLEDLEEMRENVELSLLDEAVQKAARGADNPGIWYQSGRLMSAQA